MTEDIQNRAINTLRFLSADGKDFLIDADNNFWRAISFVDNAQSHDIIMDLNHAREVGHALGTFQNLISDLSIDSLADTLEGFHITH